MRTFWQYFFGVLFLGVFIIFYFLKTDSGHQNLGYFIEDYLSAKTYNKIEVISLNLEKYPHIEIELQVNNRANITLKGEFNQYNIEMKYHLKGDSFHFNEFYLNDTIDVNGEVIGSFSSLLIKGEGRVFDGDIEYSFVNTPYEIKDMSVQMKKVNSQKIFTFFKERSLLSGSVDIYANFDYFSKYLKEGQLKIYMQDAFIPNLIKDTPLILNSTIDFKGVEYRYVADISSDIGEVILKDGYYHDGEKIVKVDYSVHLKNLAYFEKILKHNYQGALDLNGTLVYNTDNGSIEIDGYTHQFEGELSYLYKKEHIDVTLKEVSLERLLKQFSYPILFLSKIDGKIHFDIKEKSIIVNTELRDTRFVSSELTQMLYDKAGIDMLAEVYDKSFFSAGYYNSTFSSSLKIDNGKSHVYLTDTTLNLIDDRIDSNFEIKMQGQEIHGEVHGILKEPKIWIDKKKIMEYQMNKHLGWLVGY